MLTALAKVGIEFLSWSLHPPYIDGRYVGTGTYLTGTMQRRPRHNLSMNHVSEAHDIGVWIRVLPLRCENSTAKTDPSGPTMSETCETLVPDAAPRYRTFALGLMWMLSMPASMEAASFDRKGFHILYSIFLDSPSTAGSSTLTRFSPYTLSPVFNKTIQDHWNGKKMKQETITLQSYNDQFYYRCHNPEES